MSADANSTEYVLRSQLADTVQECEQLRTELERLRGTCDDAGHRAWFDHLAEAGAAGPSEAGGGDDMPELLRRLAADRPELFYPLADDTLRAELGQVKAAARFADLVELAAERDAALALLREVRATMENVTEDAIKFLPEEGGKRYAFAAGFNSAAFAVRQHIDESHLLDDEGQHQ